MVWSNWRGAVVVLFAWAGFAWTQVPAPVAVGVLPERIMVVNENGRSLRCRILESWQLPDGKMAHQVQVLNNGEMLTIIDEKTASSSSLFARPKAARKQIFHWGTDNLIPPPGVPLPPHASIENMAFHHEVKAPAPASGPLVQTAGTAPALPANALRQTGSAPPSAPAVAPLVGRLPDPATVGTSSPIPPYWNGQFDAPAPVAPPPTTRGGAGKLLAPATIPAASRVPAITNFGGRAAPSSAAAPCVPSSPDLATAACCDVCNVCQPTPPTLLQRFQGLFQRRPSSCCSLPSTEVCCPGTTIVCTPAPKKSVFGLLPFSAAVDRTQIAADTSSNRLKPESQPLSIPAPPQGLLQQPPLARTTRPAAVAPPAPPSPLMPASLVEAPALVPPPPNSRVMPLAAALSGAPVAVVQAPAAPVANFPAVQPAPMQKLPVGAPEPKTILLADAVANSTPPPNTTTKLVKLPPEVKAPATLAAPSGDILMMPERFNPAKAQAKSIPRPQVTAAKKQVAPAVKKQPTAAALAKKPSAPQAAPVPETGEVPQTPASVLVTRGGLPPRIAYIPVPLVTMPRPLRSSLPPAPEVPEPSQPAVYQNAFTPPPQPQAPPNSPGPGLAMPNMLPAPAPMAWSGGANPYYAAQAQMMNAYAQQAMLAHAYAQQAMLANRYAAAQQGSYPAQQPHNPYPGALAQPGVAQVGYLPPAPVASPVEQLTRVLQESPYPSQREWAAQSLSALEARTHAQLVPILQKAATHDPAASVRAGCVHALARLYVAPTAYLSTLETLRADADPRVRAEVEKALARRGESREAPARIN
jgi:hypothetical protein